MGRYGGHFLLHDRVAIDLAAHKERARGRRDEEADGVERAIQLSLGNPTVTADSDSSGGSDGEESDGSSDHCAGGGSCEEPSRPVGAAGPGATTAMLASARIDQLRMFRRHLMQLIYAGAQCWQMTDAVQRRLNWWTAGRTAIIAGTDRKTECHKRRVHTVGHLKHWRRRLLGDILRKPPDDMRRPEVLRMCAMVMWGLLDRKTTMLSDVADFDSLDELKRMAGCAPPEAIESRGIKERAFLEKQHMQWIEDDKALKPK